MTQIPKAPLFCESESTPLSNAPVDQEEKKDDFWVDEEEGFEEGDLFNQDIGDAGNKNGATKGFEGTNKSRTKGNTGKFFGNQNHDEEGENGDGGEGVGSKKGGDSQEGDDGEGDDDGGEGHFGIIHEAPVF